MVRALVDNNSVFTGEKIVTITKAEEEVYKEVKSILEKLGYTIFTVENNSLRETKHFFKTSLPALLEKTDSGVVYYCHSKGISYHPESEDGKASSLWTDVLLENTLYNVPSFAPKHSTWGSCRVIKKNFLPDNHNELFSYVGTFFWIRVEKLVDHNIEPHSKFTLEALPGLTCRIGESYNSGPSLKAGESPYYLDTWRKKGYEV